MMDLLSDIDLLKQWVARHDRDAMGELICREIDFVYATAVRQVRDPHLAEDVTQAVFILLMHKAHRITSGGALTRWLYTTTRYASANAMKMQRRRNRHEREAAMITSELQPDRQPMQQQENSAMLDEAINRLPRADRTCVVMTYLQQKGTQEVAAELGLSGDAVRMRVSRSVKRMREFLESRGIMGDAATFPNAQRQPKAPTHLAASTLNLLVLSQIGEANTNAAAIAKAVTGMRLAWQIKIAEMIVFAIGIAGIVAGQVLQPTPAAENVAVTASTQPANVVVKSYMTIGQLLDGARARREASRDLSISYSWRYVIDAPNAVRSRNEHENLVIKGNKFYRDNSSVTVGGRLPPRLIQRVLSYDGQRSTLYQPDPQRRAINGAPPEILGVEQGESGELKYRDRFIIELNLLLPPDTFTSHASLEYLLSDWQAKVRDELKLIDGHHCHVVDAPTNQKVIYIDVERGFVPLRWERLDQRGNPSIYAWSDHVIEAEKGIWIATHGFRHVVAIPEVRAFLTADTEMEIAVDGWQTDHPALAINSDVKDSFFELWDRVPRGTYIWDKVPDSQGTITDKDPTEPIPPPSLIDSMR